MSPTSTTPPTNDIQPGSGMTADVDPFAAISAAMTSQFTRPLSKSTLALLVIFLLFHALIATFSLLILIGPYIGGKKRSHWLFRKSYIPSNPGEKVEKTPLYMMNTGFFMCIAQLLGSLSTIAFICLQFNPARSLDYALHAEPLIPLGLMYLFEMLAYWIMAHCFLALSYSAGTVSTRSSLHRLTRWDPPPILVNAVFTCVPVCMVAAILGTIVHGSEGFGHVLSQLRSTLEVLSRGSSDLKRLQNPSLPALQKISIQSDLARVQSELNALTPESVTNLRAAIYYHHWSQILFLVFMCITCLVFILSFVKLTEKLLLQGQEPISHSPKSHQFYRSQPERADSYLDLKSQSSAPMRTYLGTLKSDRQLLGFTVRAYATIIAMVTSIACFLISIFRATDVIINPTWHGVITWLPTVSGSWSAIPVAWQCWRLYSD
ncbi:hypothetical protein PCASD_14080 [Puccinia coronata f. sp. avenae]|uniref:Uncharacterized protein n=1 Tax=Puccinia coronata f. sp. avenae TaxID=200324 RepID=A0A2N5TC23_9BASI|nr:hypothetical protein PCASD_14080 [Puccinia coronata f. sp. avenae]